ncbi:glycosyltransferase family 2 protein [Halalkalibacter alkalisediminis]|uniref:Glycosyltransferase family 2 protein n=1 Tax=Halalkalibacter alkalisediminis TaxID=935616 RepID=A0ABV6NFP8_9BACI|nr:glycosyltransferase family 2 protein [Halalkalibacter alkalisediminis]
MTISVVIPTLGKREAELLRLFNSLANQTISHFEVVIVSQANHEIVSRLLNQVPFSYQHIRIDRLGLSHARNIGMSYIKNNIVTFSDDDCWYHPGAFKEVMSYYETHDSDIVCYQIYDPESKEYYKTYLDYYQHQIRRRDLFRKSSIEFFIDVSKVDQSLMVFDEDFGLGAKYPSGEENLFLFKMYQKGYKISYVPKIIVYHAKPPIQSRLNYQTFVSKGPLFKRMYNTPIALTLLTGLFFKKLKHLERPILYYKDAVKELFFYQK